MAHSIELIRDQIKISGTANHRGLALTLVVTAYDNGMLHIGHTPVGSGPVTMEGGSSLGWMECSESVGGYLTEFCRQVEQRRRDR
jgi:hypothetical protein